MDSDKEQKHDSNKDQEGQIPDKAEEEGREKKGQAEAKTKNMKDDLESLKSDNVEDEPNEFPEALRKQLVSLGEKVSEEYTALGKEVSEKLKKMIEAKFSENEKQELLEQLRQEDKDHQKLKDEWEVTKKKLM